MAGDWIKIESGTPDKPELSVMAEILGIDQDAVFGKLFRIWAWADQNIDIDSNDESNGDSVTVCVTKKLIDRVSLCTGFADAMQHVGWLVEAGDAITLPNFRRHNGKSAKNRAVTAKRVAKFKNNGNDKGNAKGNGGSVTNVGETALPREEKSKEQKRQAAPAAPFDFKADLFAKWKDLPQSGGGAFLSKLFRDYKPDDRVVEAVERTLSDTRADPKAFVLGILKSPQASEKRIDGWTLEESLRMAI